MKTLFIVTLVVFSLSTQAIEARIQALNTKDQVAFLPPLRPHALAFLPPVHPKGVDA
jgi:hypothetical protein